MRDQVSHPNEVPPALIQGYWDAGPRRDGQWQWDHFKTQDGGMGNVLHWYSVARHHHRTGFTAARLAGEQPGETSLEPQPWGQPPAQPQLLSSYTISH